MGKPIRIAVFLAALLIAGSVEAASVDITAELLPGQSGPVYGWSLRISTQNVAVAGFAILVSGFDSFEYNLGYPPLYIGDSAYEDNPLGDGRDLLVLNGAGPGITLVPAFSSNVFLGTLRGPSNTVATVVVEDCEFECEGTVLATDFTVVTDFSIIVIPEPETLPLGTALLAAAALALRTARRRLA